MTLKGHYLMLVLPDGKHAVRREYVPLEREDETVAEATERWITAHPTMVKRQRNRERTANALRAGILERRLCRPTSWWTAKIEREGLPFGKNARGRRVDRRTRRK